MSDIGGKGWSFELLEYLNNHGSENIVVVALFRSSLTAPARLQTGPTLVGLAEL